MASVAELRIYKTKPGQREDWLRTFQEKSRPEHARIGMKILGPYLSVDDDDSFFWVRIFPDVAERDRMKAQFYDGELWHTELKDLLLPALESYHAVLIETPTSWLEA